ncbi:MAG TPA: TIGR00153 family protein [Gammaproteobacteria bacterium]|nr:TIGR00153 family protein [Gammaproteobacteria bacterium]
MSSSILNLFGRSPIGPLEEHMGKVHACVKELLPFFEAVLSENWQQVEAIQTQIMQLENEADTMKRDLRIHLPKGLFMPVARSDLLELLSVQDRLANKAKDIAGVVLGRKLTFPPSLASTFPIFLKRCIEASQQANAAIHELDELLETSFSGNEIKLVEDMISHLWQIERDTDKLQIHLRQAVFEIENKLSPVDVIFLYQIIEWTGDLANHARDIGDRLQILLAR